MDFVSRGVSRYLMGFLLLGFSGLTIAEDLLSIYSEAKQNDPAYLMGLHQHGASSEVYQQARSGLLPTIAVNASHSETQQDIISSDHLCAL